MRKNSRWNTDPGWLKKGATVVEFKSPNDVRPVFDAKGEPILYDVFIGGKWVGSRRTAEMAERMALSLNPPTPATPDMVE